jgi:hypothetical protein
LTDVGMESELKRPFKDLVKLVAGFALLYFVSRPRATSALEKEVKQNLFLSGKDTRSRQQLR